MRARVFARRWFSDHNFVRVAEGCITGGAAVGAAAGTALTIGHGGNPLEVIGGAAGGTVLGMCGGLCAVPAVWMAPVAVPTAAVAYVARECAK